jgi:glycosyltransferase involved in cell wall biosynthesis
MRIRGSLDERALAQGLAVPRKRSILSPCANCVYAKLAWWMSELRIAFVSEGDPSDRHAFSGLTFSIWRSLADAGAAIDLIGGVTSWWKIPAQLRAWLFRKLLHQPFLRGRSPRLLKSYARKIERRLAGKSYDGIFSPGTTCLAHLRESRPIAFWTDATFARLVAFYPEYRNLHPASARQGNRMETLAYTRSGACIFSSDWAAASALSEYHVPSAKVHVVPFGPNLESGLEEDAARRHILARRLEPLRIVFVGVDWQRKGGEFALEVIRDLRDRGCDLRLAIVGCSPDLPTDLQPFCSAHGFISKAEENGRTQLRDIMLGSDLLLLASQSDCCPVAFAEASAFGIPSIGFDVGGSRTLVRDGVNGKLFPPDTSARDIGSFIYTLVRDRQKYVRLSLSSYEEYRQRLNWGSSAKAVLSLLETCFRA